MVFKDLCALDESRLSIRRDNKLFQGLLSLETDWQFPSEVSKLYYCFFFVVLQ